MNKEKTWYWSPKFCFMVWTHRLAVSGWLEVVGTRLRSWVSVTLSLYDLAQLGARVRAGKVGVMQQSYISIELFLPLLSIDMDLSYTEPSSEASDHNREGDREPPTDWHGEMVDAEEDWYKQQDEELKHRRWEDEECGCDGLTEVERVDRMDDDQSPSSIEKLVEFARGQPLMGIDENEQQRGPGWYKTSAGWEEATDVVHKDSGS